MYFLHVKIFGTSLNKERLDEGLALSPSVFVKREDLTREAVAAGAMDSWIYTVENDDPKGLESSIDALADHLYKRKELFEELVREKASLYFVLTPYPDSYQVIISLKNDVISKLSEMGFCVTVDIMSV